MSRPVVDPTLVTVLASRAVKSQLMVRKFGRNGVLWNFWDCTGGDETGESCNEVFQISCKCSI